MTEPLAFDHFDDAVGWLRTTFTAWVDQLEAGERDAVRIYKGDGYEDINDYLRYAIDPDAAPDDIDAVIGRIDGALRKACLPEPVIAYRAFESELLAVAIESGGDLIGDEIDDEAFLSTSLLRDVCRGFLTGSGIDVLGRILIPGGAHVGAFVGAPDLVYDLHEVELLLPRQTVLRITAVTPAASPDEPHHLDMEVILK